MRKAKRLTEIGRNWGCRREPEQVIDNCVSLPMSQIVQRSVAIFQGPFGHCWRCTLTGSSCTTAWGKKTSKTRGKINFIKRATSTSDSQILRDSDFSVRNCCQPILFFLLSFDSLSPPSPFAANKLYRIFILFNSPGADINSFLFSFFCKFFFHLQLTQ